MDIKSAQIVKMIDMLPQKEQELAFEMVKRILLAWDSEFTKLTPYEKKDLVNAQKGEYFTDDEIDWNNLSKYN